MSGKLLVFEFESLMSVMELGKALSPLGVEVVPVARNDYHQSIGVLAGLDRPSGSVPPYAGGTLGGRMAVLCQLDDRLDQVLEILSKTGEGASCLKAVLTPRNRTWNPVMLYGELRREHAAMRGKRG